MTTESYLHNVAGFSNACSQSVPTYKIDVVNFGNAEALLPKLATAEALPVLEIDQTALNDFNFSTLVCTKNVFWKISRTNSNTFISCEVS